MYILFCKLDTASGIREFELENFNKLSSLDLKLLESSYLYSVYYNKIITDMDDNDLDAYSLFDAPFNKSVFILKSHKDSKEFFKLNCVTSPPSYYISSFNPSTGKSEIITDKSRDVLLILKEKLFLQDWNKYKKIFYFLPKENSQTNDYTQLELEDFGGLKFEASNSEERLLNNSSIQLQESSLNNYQKISSTINKYDKMPIQQRKIRLEKLKIDLVNAKKVRNLKKSLLEIDKKISNLNKFKNNLKKKNEILEQREVRRSTFNDINWINDDIYEKLTSYIEKKDKYLREKEHLEKKLEKNNKKIEGISSNPILKHKIFMPTAILGIITFTLSWVMRDQFWYLSAVAIVFFSIAFYFLWEYSDELEYILSLKREKRFFLKKLEKEDNNFKKLFATLEMTLRKENVKDINVAISRYKELKSFEENIISYQDEILEYKNKYFSEKEEDLLLSLEKQKQELEDELARFDSVEFFVEEIEHDLSLLKTSIKNYEKEELDTFSLDDPKEEPEELSFSTKSISNYKFNYSLDFLFTYFKEYTYLWNLSPEELYENIKSDFLDITEFVIHYNHIITFDINLKDFKFHSEVEIEDWEEYKEKFKFFLLFSIFKYSLEKPNPLFIKIDQITEYLNIDITPYIKGIEKTQVIS